MAATHGLVTAHHIFDGRYPQMPPVRQSIAKRRPVIERKRMPLFGFFQWFVERVVRAPKCQDFLFHARKVCTWVCLWVCHLHNPLVVCSNKNGRSARPGNVPKRGCHLFNNDYGLLCHFLFLVPVTGLEPTTPSLRMRCSTSWATPASDASLYYVSGNFQY